MLTPEFSGHTQNFLLFNSNLTVIVQGTTFNFLRFCLNEELSNRKHQGYDYHRKIKYFFNPRKSFELLAKTSGANESFEIA